ncbi:outer membrane lipoprotein chaperone LolA [Gilvimarinus algae]|uniref:Outer-membrane lipoprotein carrier protein n=1 Tax=Gilvimarinus algae TaxID=3058037 RepID=A0ABT8TD74_9GAMM|nr:outer membrane lipoprotein chaperone LolA [Gilvimarinus sp. SDUM040014]MDO3382066.1 outer membrane lipoprotein chaperone LolA [Gilvimarinus sp. SDUM040014]
MTFRKILASLVMFCWLPASLAQSAGEELTSRLANLVSLQGTFTQVLLDDAGREMERSSGRFVMQKPGRFYWETLEPFPQQLISNGQTIWLYDPDLMQVTVRQLDEQLEKTPALLLSRDPKALTTAYDVSKVKEQVYTLTPTESEPLFVSLTMTFSDTGISEVSVEDGLGQRTVFSLTDTRVNLPVDESLFHFNAPEGVDVLID